MIRSHRFSALLLPLALALFAASPAMAQLPTAVATYDFNNTLAAEQSGAPALVATDPLGQNSFQTDTVLTHTKQVYSFVGNNSPTDQQAGLTLQTSGLITSNDYSVEMVFKFTQRDNAWRRIVDVQDRQSDNGFYVDPSNDLDVYPVSGSNVRWTNDEYHHVVLTVAPDNTVSAYLDGIGQFSTTTTVMDINNPNNVMNLFLDNVVAGGQGEYSGGSISLLRIYDHALTAPEVSLLYKSVPGPNALVTFAAGALPGASLLLRRRRRS